MRRAEVLGAQVRPRELEDELAALPERSEVRDERRQSDLVRFVDVPFPGELVVRGARLGDRAHAITANSPAAGRFIASRLVAPAEGSFDEACRS